MSKAVELARYYQRHFPAFANDCLKIMLEESGLGPLSLNNTQSDLHSRLERQLNTKGKVRAIILKPRREGMSTYIGARFFHKTIYGNGLNTRITTHLDRATKALFKMVKTFHQKMPVELRPMSGEDSANSLTFPYSNGSYALSTARSSAAGRAELTHLLHCSEVAYWHDAEEVVSSTVETVGDKPGTEIIFESTGAPGTYFEELWAKSLGTEDYENIFYPWYISDRNTAPAVGLVPTAEEKELLKVYPAMTLENIAFRRAKLVLSSEAKFRREYPATPADAFTADADESFISPEIVEIAAHRKHEPFADDVRILGVDPSQTSGGDYCGLVLRHGNKVEKLAKFRRERVQERTDIIKRFFADNNCDHMFIDQGGSGKEIYDLLIEWGVPRPQITLVPFGASSSNKALYPNKRVEMYHLARNWLTEEGCIPNDMEFKAELSLTKSVIDNSGQEVLEKKKNMRRSPNLADAFVLTFAYPVKARNVKHRRGSY
nr:large terminase protein [Caudoviricetes sp.]